MKTPGCRLLSTLTLVLALCALIAGCPPVVTPPSAAFTSSTTTGPPPLLVEFSDQSTAGTSPITAWAWNFGDGGTSTEANPSHTYDTMGTYTVSLKVTTKDGSDTETKPNLITVGDMVAPTAVFSATNTVGDAPLSVQFIDRSVAGTSAITARLWSFGDGATSTEQNPTHVYESAGTFGVTLTITTADGMDDEFQDDLVRVTTGTGTAPVAAFSADPTAGESPLLVQFTDESTPGSSAIATWSWDFGDGTTSSQPNPSHIYATTGNYTVALTVTTQDGFDTETQPDLIAVGEEAAWAPESSTFDVDVAENVIVVEKEDLPDVILQYNPDEHAYLLDKTVTDAMGLTLDVGDPLILAGIEVGRISIVEVDESGIYLETERIPLNEVFTDGEIAWDYGVEFTTDSVKSIEIPGVGEFDVKAGTPINITFEQGAFKYELKVTLNGTTADFDFTVTKGLATGVKGRFTAKGEFVRFRNQNQIRFESGELTSFGHELNGLRGTADLKLVVAGSGGDAIDFKIPVPILKIPFVIGYIPAVVSVGAQFVVNAAVPLEGSAQVGTSFAYDSDIGFTYNGTQVMAGGRAGETTFGNPLHMTGAATAISANFGIGYPRVSLDVAGGTLVPWAQTAFLVGGAYTFTPPCQSADAQFIGAAGYNLGILGFDLASGSVKLFEQKKELLRAGQCTKSEGTDAAADALSSDALSSDALSALADLP